MKFLFTAISGNAKTGPISTTISSRDNCPEACVLKAKGCYAASGPLAIHWARVTKEQTGLAWNDFLSCIRRIRKGSLWRHNTAGDLVGTNNAIDTVKLRELTLANNGKDVICYTHYPVLDSQSPEAAANRAAISAAIKGGFNINLSANTLAHADKLLALKIAPVVAIVPSAQVTNCKTPNGARVVICPASIRENVTCATCGICARGNREYVVGFPAHGVAKRAVDVIAQSGAVPA